MTKTKKRRRKADSKSSAPPAPPKDAAGDAAKPWPPAPAGLPATNALAALLLCLLVAVCLFPATRAGFVWDDEILLNAKAVRTLSGLQQIWFHPRSILGEGHYWPILYTTFWLEHLLWKLEPLGYHLVSLSLHSAVALLLWRLLRRLEVPGAWLAAAVFAVHPVHVESAVWIIGRKDLLASLFYLGCVLAYLRFAEDGRWGRYALALALFTLSLLSKALAVTLPVTLLIWHGWKRGRVTAKDAQHIAPFVLLGLAIITADLIHYRSIESRSFDYSLLERALMAAQSLWFYAGKLVWPADLAVIYPHWDLRPDNLPAWAAVAAGVAVVAALWLARNRVGRGPLAGVLFFAVTLSPVLGFIDFGYMRYSFVADRYQYLASAGVIAALVGAATYAARRLPGPGRAGVQVAAVALLGALGALSWQQTEIYRDNISFYSHVTALNPKARSGHSNLGLAYQKVGRYEEALEVCRIEYDLARQHPGDRIWNAWANVCVGRAAEMLGQLEDAEKHFRYAYELSPSARSIIAYLGAFLVNTANRPEEAIKYFQILTEMQPGNPTYHIGLGASLAGVDRHREAVQSYDRAIELAPYMEQAHKNREISLRSLEKKRQP